MKKFLLNISIFGAISLVIMYGLDFYFTSVFQEGKTNKTQWLEQKENEHYDVALIGSSRAWWNMDMNQINDSLGIRSVNIANNHFSYSEMLLRLKRFNENGNRLDHLYIQTEYYNLFSDDTSLSMTALNNLPFLDDETTYEHLKQKGSEWMLYKYFPFWRYAEYNHQWGIEEVMITELGMRNSIYDSTGTFLSNDRFYGTPAQQLPYPTSSSIHPDFLKLIDYCREQGINVHVYTSPIYFAQGYTQVQQIFEDKLDSLNLPYRNYTHLFDNVQDSVYFNDNVHLSTTGGRAFTPIFIEDLRLDLAK